MTFTEKYTTTDKIVAEEADKDITDKIEKTKTVLPLETFALGEVIQDLINKIEHTRCSLMK